MERKCSKALLVTIATLLLFAVVLGAAVYGIGQVSSSSRVEGVHATRQAIERAAVMCYASEGFYPPNLAYIEDNYGLQIDYTRYVVRYEIFASNVMPNITVVAR
jgi:hypothetical protein